MSQSGQNVSAKMEDEILNQDLFEIKLPLSVTLIYISFALSQSMILKFKNVYHNLLKNIFWGHSIFTWTRGGG